MCFRQRCTTDFRQNAPLFSGRNAIFMMELLSRTLGVGAGSHGPAAGAGICELARRLPRLGDVGAIWPVRLRNLSLWLTAPPVLAEDGLELESWRRG